MTGVLEALEGKYTPAEWAQLLDSGSLATGRYEREPGTITSALPLAKHSYWTAKTWTWVEVVDVPLGTLRRE